MTQLVYDVRDDKLFEQRGMKNLYWLDDMGAIPLSELDPAVDSFLYTGARSIDDYQELTAPYPKIRDTVSARQQLLNLDSVLLKLVENGVEVGSPQTWIWQMDRPIPDGIRYPVFVRSAKSSWKLGGRISKVANEKELELEAFELRRAFGFDQPILAREWLDILSVGNFAYGEVPLEIRTWIVDSIPFAWSFHHLQIVQDPKLFPLSDEDLDRVYELASRLNCFASRLVCADIVKTVDGVWHFLEAGPGSCAGTAHEFVFKSVAAKLAGGTFDAPECLPGDFGQLFNIGASGS